MFGRAARKAFYLLITLGLMLPRVASAEYYPSTADPCADHHFTDCDPVCAPGTFCVKDQMNGSMSCMKEIEYFGVLGGEDAGAATNTCYAITPMRTGADDVGVGLLYY